MNPDEEKRLVGQYANDNNWGAMRDMAKANPELALYVLDTFVLLLEVADELLESRRSTIYELLEYYATTKEVE